MSHKPAATRHDFHARPKEGATTDAQTPAQPASDEQIRRRRQWMEERLAGDESLRSELADDEAQVLMDWAQTQAAAWAKASAAIADDQQAKDALQGALRSIMAMARGINRFAGANDPRDEDAAAAQLCTLFVASPAGAFPDLQEACRAVAREEKAMTKAGLVRRLTAIAGLSLGGPEGPRLAQAEEGGSAS